MTLDIGIHIKGNSKDPLERVLVVNLEDVDLAYLDWIFVKAHKKTGIEITSYYDARLQGLMCHHYPVGDWKETDPYSISASFTDIM